MKISKNKLFSFSFIIAVLFILAFYNVPLTLKDAPIFKNENFDYDEVFVVDLSSEEAKDFLIKDKTEINQIINIIINSKVKRCLIAPKEYVNSKPYSNYNLKFSHYVDGKREGTGINIGGSYNTVYITIINSDNKKKTFKLQKSNDFKSLHNTLYKI